MERTLSISSDGALLEGDLRLVDDAVGLVVLAHVSGSSRQSPLNRLLARALEHHGLSTLRLDLLSNDERDVDAIIWCFRFNIPFLARRLGEATDELSKHESLRHLPIGYFAASAEAAAALIAATERPNVVRAVVSCGGRPDLARDALAAVRAPTLLIVGGADTTGLRLNQAALAQMHSRAVLSIVPGAILPFDEPGALEQVESLAANWFSIHLPVAASSSVGDAAWTAATHVN